MALISKARRRARAEQIRAKWPAADHQIYGALGISRNELEELQNAFEGKLVLPGMPEYDADRQGNPLYPAKPRIIAYCEVFNDVRLCLKWAHQYNWWVTCRAGGHSTAGYSVNDGMVIDVSRIDYVVINKVEKRVRIGAGGKFGAINSMLDTYKVHIPGGGCDGVGVAGFMQGGGYGFTSREYGMNCDNVVGITLMLANGRIVVANAAQNRDLFWAVRGGTGNNFGVLLEIEYALHNLHEVWGVCVQWPVDQGVAVLRELQRTYMRSGASSKLGYQLALATQDIGPALVLMGMYHGPEVEAHKAIQPITQIGAPQMRFDEMGTYAKLNETLIDDHLPGIPKTGATYELKGSGYVATNLTSVDWQLVIDYFKTTPNPYNIVGIEPYGGAINSYPVAASAFIHRNVAFDFFIDSFFQDSWQYNTRAGAQNWLDGFMALMGTFFNGHVYQNYPARNTPNFRWAYWGDAFEALLKVKLKYDPKCFFRFEQSISPVPLDLQDEITRPDATRLPLDLEIGAEIVFED